MSAHHQDTMTSHSPLETALFERGGRREGQEIRFRCPAHDDAHPSASFNAIHPWIWPRRSCKRPEVPGFHQLAPPFAARLASLIPPELPPISHRESTG